jgi:hypothetical protein
MDKLNADTLVVTGATEDLTNFDRRGDAARPKFLSLDTFCSSLTPTTLSPGGRDG